MVVPPTASATLTSPPPCLLKSLQTSLNHHHHHHHHQPHYTERHYTSHHHHHHQPPPSPPPPPHPSSPPPPPPPADGDFEEVHDARCPPHGLLPVHHGLRAVAGRQGLRQGLLRGLVPPRALRGRGCPQRGARRLRGLRPGLPHRRRGHRLPARSPPRLRIRRVLRVPVRAGRVRCGSARPARRDRRLSAGSPAARGRPPVFAATPGDSAAQLHQLRQPGGHKRGTLPPGRRQPRGAHGAGPQEGPGPEWGPLRLALRLPGSTLVDARRGRSSWCPRAQGFDATSNVLAAQVHGVPLAGTQAHSYITAFSGLHDLTTRELAVPDGGPTVDLLALSLEWRPRVCSLLGRAERDARDGELAAFVSYAQAFPRRLLLLVDTYSVHGSGTVNFCAVALALATLGLRAVGVRLDSGDLARQSLEVRAAFRCCAQSFELPWFSELKIVASNDVNEEKILAYNKQGHAIDCFGVGTALVTCERQPSLGCIYKLVELDGVPRCKLTEDEEKTTLPGRKAPYRLYGDDGRAVLDVLLGVEELAPRAGQLLPCRLLRPLGEQSLVRPSRVAPLHTTFWDRGRVCSPLLPLKELRAMSAASLGELGAEHKDLEAPTPYPVAVSEKIWALLEEMRRP
ncbi:nicotinate phosphoribosyltransferase isoform X1 [Petromyzon marinus]|uniref:nicotinate phosphoribosyltransferase isoform X1 n=1 Tax=Petromyzon marinus TaxID=7757 RepID=UPI003F70BA68